MKKRAGPVGAYTLGAVPFALLIAALFLVPVSSAGPVHPRTGPVAASCGVGNFPSFPAYDAANHLIYVPNQGSGNISVVKSPCKVVKTISLPAGAAPIQAAFSPANDAIYVVDNNLQQVYVIENNAIVTTINGGHFSYPTAIGWDPGDSIMLVANFGWSNVSAISNVSYTASIATGSQPDSISYDPYYSSVLIDCFGSSNITILPNASFPYNAGHTSTNYGGGGEMMAFDPADDLDYSASYSLASVTVLNGVGGYFGSVSVGHAPLDIAFDQSTLHMFVTNEASHSVFSISGFRVTTKFTLAKGLDPFGLTYSDFALSMYTTVYNGTTHGGELVELS